MKDLFVSYEQALQLKELGFDEPCITYYYEDSKTIRTGLSIHINNGWTYSGTKRLETTLAPLKQQAFRWFREKHNLLHDIAFFREDKRTKKGYWHKIYKWNADMVKREIISNNSYFYTYEETEMACIDELIELVKKK